MTRVINLSSTFRKLIPRGRSLNVSDKNYLSHRVNWYSNPCWAIILTLAINSHVRSSRVLNDLWQRKDRARQSLRLCVQHIFRQEFGWIFSFLSHKTWFYDTKEAKYFQQFSSFLQKKAATSSMRVGKPKLNNC